MLQLYGGTLSSPTNKVRYVANYLNIPYEFHPLNLALGQHRSEEYLKINPMGKIPAINDEGFTLGESNAIIRYLADKQQSSLYPRDLHQRAQVDEWMDYASQHVAVATAKIMLNTHFYKYFNIEPDQRSLQEGHDFLARYLPVVDQQLSKNQFIASNQISLADFAMVAALDVCELALVDLSTFTQIAAWREKLMHEAFYTSCHESYTAMFKNFMEKRNVQIAKN